METWQLVLTSTMLFLAILFTLNEYAQANYGGDSYPLGRFLTASFWSIFFFMLMYFKYTS